ncbi:hypothetical protein [Parasphingopyxis marina]|uniref:Uncharacterized protein n=1 Tax=Parasphingopyxis marina TaxID=2761622 RepID=A0A842HXK8_9SPHN|nr:hypothetical protein [Parasphingopyxis marina]MBC2777071.1 hypothetical protein [Parasphingopyxis marina]
MTDKKKTEELKDAELDDVQGGGNMEIQKPAATKSGDGSVRTADGFLSSGHTTGSNILSSGHGTNNVKAE